MHPKFKAMLEVQMIGVLSFVGKFNKKRKQAIHCIQLHRVIMLKMYIDNNKLISNDQHLLRPLSTLLFFKKNINCIYIKYLREKNRYKYMAINFRKIYFSNRP